MIYIERLILQNYKKFRKTEILLHKNINIIVGNNEEGKSTILEAIHLALSGMIDGRPLRYDISEYLFNLESVQEYKSNRLLPEILIEIYLSTDNEADKGILALLEGDGNSKREKHAGISFKVCFDEQYQSEYQQMVSSTEAITSLPVEYYKIEWQSFAREGITSKSIPLKSAMIDSTTSRFSNGSDVYISKIIKDGLEDCESIRLSQAYRELKKDFSSNGAIKDINDKLTHKAQISSKQIQIYADMSVRNSWETVLMTYIDEIPFTQVGKGEQCIIKTNLALAHAHSKKF